MTPSNFNISQREIVWLEFIYTDYSNTKKRPGLIVSNNSYNKTHLDVICCAITSQNRNDCCIPIDNSDIESGNRFTKDSRVRYDWILKVDKKLINSKFAKLNKQKTQEIIDSIQGLINIE